jgi:hypothetical protein
MALRRKEMSVTQDVAYYLPAKYRKALYTTLSVVGLVLLATTTGFLAVAATLPKWLIAAQAVFGVISTATHYVAKVNVPSQAVEDAR